MSLAAQERLFAVPQSATTSDDYWTPPWVFERLALNFDLDVAAPPGGIPWVPTKKFYTQEDDGLASQWFGRIWMNPPYSNPTPWVDRFIAHGNGVALLPTSNGAWFGRLWAAEVGFVTLEYLRFYNENGEMGGAIPTRCWLVAAGEDNLWAIAKFGRLR